MKKYLFVFAIALSLMACRSTKKITESKVETTVKTEVVQKADVKEVAKTDNDKATYKKTTIVETEYLPPVASVETPKQTSNVVVPPTAQKVIKSTKTTIIEEGSKDNSTLEVVKTDNSQVATTVDTETKTEVKVVEKKTNPIRWGWIAVVLIIAIGGFVYLNNKFNIVGWLKSLFIKK